MTERENKVKIQVPEIVGEGTFEGFVETDIEAPKDKSDRSHVVL